MTNTEPIAVINGYALLELRAETEYARVYLCRSETGDFGLFKIVTDASLNSRLDREAYILQILREGADRAERDYEPLRQKPDERLNYHIAFPRLVETFECGEEQGNRRALVVAIPASAGDVGDLTAVDLTIGRDELRVDPKTSAWIMGKLLKLLVLTDSLGISPKITADNVFVNRRWHYVAIFDWSDADIVSGGISGTTSSVEIAEAARVAIAALGGNFAERKIPEDDQLPDSRYADILFAMAGCEFQDAAEAHRKFYEVITDLWGNNFHKFRAYHVPTGEVVELEDE